jgi:purine-binding chemotaxis protein CheW
MTARKPRAPRAAAARVAAAPEPVPASRQVVVCALAGEEYALPVEGVQEIIRYTQPRTVPSAPLGVRGVINLRGRIITVCDLTQRLGLAVAPGAESKIVVVEAGGEMMGLVVDDVSEVKTLSTDEIEPPLRAGDGSISGVARVGDRLLVLLDLPVVLGGVLDARMAA